MNDPSPWELLKDELTEWEKGLPTLSDGEESNLLSIGAALPQLLFEADDQGREALDAVILERIEGGEWPEIRTTWKVLLRDRFEWAFVVLQTMERCQIPVPDDFPVSELLIQGWDSGGASYTHDDFLRRHLPELLQRATGGRSGGAGG